MWIGRFQSPRERATSPRPEEQSRFATLTGLKAVYGRALMFAPSPSPMKRY